MAPTLLSRAEGALGTDDDGVRIALIVLISIVSALALAVVILLIIKFYKRRQQYDTVPQPSPSIPSLESGKKPKTMRRDITEQEELQRLVMIRKSLASRTSMVAESRASHRGDEDLDTESSSSRPGSLRSDWKEFEAGIQSQRSVSLENHPVLKNSPEHSCDSYGRRVSSPAMAELPRHSPSPHSIRSSLASPPPVTPRTDQLPYSRPPRNSWQRAPPQPSASLEPLRTPHHRPTSDPPRMMPRRGTFDSVPEEYCGVPLTESEKPRQGWI